MWFELRILNFLKDNNISLNVLSNKLDGFAKEMVKYYFDDYGMIFHVDEDEDPQIGLDMYGNIVMDKGCVYVPRGGWRDANNNYYTVTPEEGKLGPLNIFFETPVLNSSYNIEMQRKLNNILK